jgi:hypothetical protein
MRGKGKVASIATSTIWFARSMMKLNEEQWRALRMIAESEPQGCTDATLMRCFTLHTIVDLINGNLAGAYPELVRAGGRPIKTIRVRITDSGRRRLSH